MRSRSSGRHRTGSPPPCPHAGPGRCGGCDWQHASGAAQRELKAQVVREQFRRVGRARRHRAAPRSRGAARRPAGLADPHRCTPSTRTAGWDCVGIGRTTSSRSTRARSAWPGVGDQPGAAPYLARLPTRSPQRRAATATTTLLGHRKPRAAGEPAARPPDVIDVLDGAGSAASSRGSGTTSRSTRAASGRCTRRAAPALVGAILLRTAAAAWGGRPRPVRRRGAVRRAARRGGGRSRPGRRRRRSTGRPSADARSNLRRSGAPGRGAARPGVGRDRYALASCRRGPGSGRARPAAGRRRRRRDARDRSLPGHGRSATWPATRRHWPATCAAAGDAGWRLAELRAFDAFPMTHHVECVAILDSPTGDDARRLGA